ncbi:TetR/AcrR family transcriptional regulator [Zhongshania sp. BJYM1]|uniref:TetR/AcrR family transcriptional regulator n=1 Tax=Zhongshania aquatica TaxID=2965069 RepID=UPI0022B53EA2|nr:TetR/AcrR family transcriptional regulator [Marortus sp. BJYM1]
MARPRVREKILDAAYELLQSEGIAVMTTRRIAECAGTTEASVFNNFGDKAGLLYALVGERLPEVQAVKAAVNADPQDDIGMWLQDVYQKAQLFYTAIIPLTSSLWGREEYTASTMGEKRHPLHDMVVARFVEFQGMGVLAKSADTEALATAILGAALHNGFNFVAHGYVALSDGGSDKPGRMVTSLLPLFAADAKAVF